MANVILGKSVHLSIGDGDFVEVKDFRLEHEEPLDDYARIYGEGVDSLLGMTAHGKGKVHRKQMAAFMYKTWRIGVPVTRLTSTYILMLVGEESNLP